jgi:hypothetical protein
MSAISPNVAPLEMGRETASLLKITRRRDGLGRMAEWRFIGLSREICAKGLAQLDISVSDETHKRVHSQF